MDQTAWWTWVIGLILGAVITWFFSWKYGNRRRKLLFTWDAVQLMPDKGPAKGALQVFYEGKQVDDPHLLKITLKNLGPTDISTVHFDDRAPLRVEFPGGYVSPMDTDMGAAELLEVGDDYLAVQPQLLKRNAAITLDVLVDGPTTPVLVSKIIDTDVVTADAKALALGLVQTTVEITGEGVIGPAFPMLGALIKRRR